jgi:hypothetical protein
LDLFFSDCSLPMWAVLLSVLCGVGAWLLGRGSKANLIEQLQVGTNAEISAAQNGERAPFRDLLIAEMAAMRQSIKQQFSFCRGRRFGDVKSAKPKVQNLPGQPR